MDAVRPAAPTPTLAEEIEAAQAELLVSIQRGNLRDDPLRFPLQAIAIFLGLLPSIVQEARQPVDPAGIARVEEAAIKGATTGAVGQVQALAHTYRQRTIQNRVLWSGAVLVGLAGVMAGCVAAGYWLGRDTQIATASKIEAAAFRDGAGSAEMWLAFMEANYGPTVRASCAASTVASEGSREACLPPLWKKPGTNPAKVTAR